MRSFRVVSTLASSNPRIRTISAMVSFLLFFELLLSSFLFSGSAHAATITHAELNPAPSPTLQIVPHRDLVLRFNEPVLRGTGQIKLWERLAGGGLASQPADTIDVSDTARVQMEQILNSGTVVGMNVIIRLDPSKLTVNKAYTVEIPSGAFYGKNSNLPYVGITGPDDWYFTIKSFNIVPASRVPANEQTFVEADNPISLEFSFGETVQKGTGFIHVRRKNDDVIVQAINVTSSAVSIDSVSNVVSVSLAKLAHGTEYYVTIDRGAFVDQFGNPFAGISDKNVWTFATEPPLDTTKPKAVSYTPPVNGTLGNLQGALAIEFDEPVFAAGGFIYIYKNTSGQPLFCAIPVQSSAVVVNGKTVQISPSGYGCGAFENNAQYLVKIGGDVFRDASGNYFDGISNWIFRVSQDKTAPAVSSYSPAQGSTNVSVATKTFSIIFNEPVRIVSVSDSAFLFRSDSPTSRSPLALAVDSSNNRKVNLTYSGANLAANTQYSITIPAGAIQDLAGNAFPGILGQYQWTFRTGSGGTAPVLERAEMDGSSAIVLIFNVTLSTAHVPNAGNFYVTVNGAYRQVTGVTVSQNRVRLTLASAVSSGQTVRVSYSQDLYSEDRHLRSVDGQKVAAFTDRAVSGVGQSGSLRPVSGTVYGNTIILNFNRPLASLASNAYLQFSVKVGDQTAAVTGASASGDVLSLTIYPSVSSGAAVSVSYTPGANPVRDEDGNYVAAFTDFYVANPNDLQPPQLTGATASGTKVTLVYNEGLNTGMIPLPSNYSVVASNRTIPVTMVTVTGNKVELTLSSSLTAGEIVRVTYTPGSSFLADLSGNAAPALSGYQVTAVGGSTAKAQLSSATVNGSQLTLNYSAALNMGVVPQTSQYTVTADNALVAVTSVTVSGSQVVLTLASPVRAGQTVRVSYSNSGLSLQDAQNNVLDSFSGIVAINATSTVNIGLDYAAADAQKGLVLNNLAVTTGTGRTITGTSAIKYTVDEAKLTGAFNAVRSQPGGIPRRVVFQVPSAQPGAIVALPASAWLSAANTVTNGAFVVEYGGHMFELPLKAISPSKITGGIPPGAQIVIKIEAVPASSFSSALSRQGATLVGSPVEFGVYIASGAGETQVTEFDAYARRAIAVGSSTQVSANLTVVRYDPETGELAHVPTRIDRSGPQPVLTFMRKGTSIYMAVRKTSASFADMARHWAKSDVELLSAKFIVDAKTGQNFAPQEAVTRADFAKFIARGLGLSSDRAAAARFRDVGVNHAYASYIGAASKAGIVQGDTDGRFRPNDPITREEMAAMMMRAIAYAERQVSMATSALNKFEDRGRISNWAVSSVAGAVNAGIIKGVTETRFEPKNNATRAEAAVMIKRMLEYVGFLES